MDKSIDLRKPKIRVKWVGGDVRQYEAGCCAVYRLGKTIPEAVNNLLGYIKTIAPPSRKDYCDPCHVQ